MEKQTDSKPPEYSEAIDGNPNQYNMGGYPPYGQPQYPPQGQVVGQPQYPPQGQVVGQSQHPPQGQLPGYTQTRQPIFSGYTTHYGPNNTVIIQQPILAPYAGPTTPPQDYMCMSVFVTLCCFWPTGIIAIMKANESRVALARNDIASAHSSATSAKQMINISIVVGIIAIVVTAVIIGLYIGLVLTNFNWHDD